MRLILVGLFFICYQSAWCFEARVLIDENSKQKTLGGEMRLRCIGVSSSPCSSTKTWLLNSGTWSLKREGAVLLVQDKESHSRLELKGSLFEMTGSFGMDGQILHRLVLSFEPKKTLWVVHLPVDVYLYGVMAAEVPASWPAESLKAQAIASRTYFLFKKVSRKEEIYDVRSDTLDQVFKMDAKKYSSIIKAVDSTHGMILVSKQDSHIFPAYFHSDCGGHTSSENKVWRKPTSLNQSVNDPYCRSATKNNWSFFIGKDKLVSLLKGVFFLPRGSQLKSILPRIHETSRAHIVDFIFTENIIKRISADDLRKLVGFGKLKSTQFEVKTSWKDVIFEGRGFGHGVGMCQWGAQRWARKGKSYQAILGHYYPQARLLKVDPSKYKNLQAHLSF